MSSPLNFHLEHYDGPLDLLLDLIRKQEINIYDIPIAQITAQYLEYMQKALEMDIGAERRVRLHGGDADPDQVENAAAARSCAAKNWRRKKIRARSW